LDVLRARVSSGSVKDGSDPFLLIKAAQRLESYDLAQARATYLDAVTVALFATRLANGCSSADVAKAALAAPRPLGAPRPLDLLLDGLALLVAEGPTPAAPVMRQAVHAFLGQRVDIEDRVQWSWLAGRAAAFIWDYDSWDALTARQIALASDAGALAVLANTLATRVGVELFAGKASVAASLVERIEAVADATAAGAARYVAVVVDAFRGRTHDSRGLAGLDPGDYASMGEGTDGIRVTRWASAMLYNGLARYDDAFAAAAEAQEAPGELWFSRWSTVELIEAACRTGRATAAVAALDRLAAGTSASGTAWGCAVGTGAAPC
jgi:hypothetical protein